MIWKFKHSSTRRKTYYAWQNHLTSQSKLTAYHKLKSEVQRKPHHLKNSWCQAEAQEIHHLADKHNMRGFFQATKAIYGPSLHGPTPLRSHDGSTLFRDDAAIKQRWKEHFETILNHESEVLDTTIDSIPEHPVGEQLADPPGLE